MSAARFAASEANSFAVAASAVHRFLKSCFRSSLAAAAFHVARTVCRRAERLTVRLARDESVGDYARPYLNRLSDALFVFGRWAALQDGHAEPLWEPETT